MKKHILKSFLESNLESVREFGKRSGVPWQTLYNIIDGCVPRKSTLRKIFAAEPKLLGIPLDKWGVKINTAIREEAEDSQTISERVQKPKPKALRLPRGKRRKPKSVRKKS